MAPLHSVHLEAAQERCVGNNISLMTVKICLMDNCNICSFRCSAILGVTFRFALVIFTTNIPAVYSESCRDVLSPQCHGAN